MTVTDSEGWDLYGLPRGEIEVAATWRETAETRILEARLLHSQPYRKWAVVEITSPDAYAGDWLVTVELPDPKHMFISRFLVKATTYKFLANSLIGYLSIE